MKGKLFLIVGCQFINAEGMMEQKSHHCSGFQQWSCHCEEGFDEDIDIILGYLPHEILIRGENDGSQWRTLREQNNQMIKSKISSRD